MKLQLYLAVLISNILILLIIGYLPAYLLILIDSDVRTIDSSINYIIYLIIYLPLLIISMNRTYKSFSLKIKERKLGKIILKVSIVFQVIGMFYFLSVVELSDSIQQKIQFAQISIPPKMTEETITLREDQLIYKYKLKIENLTNKPINIKYTIIPVALDQNKNSDPESIVSRFYNDSIPISLPPGESYLIGRLPLYTTRENYCARFMNKALEQIDAEIKVQLMLHGDSHRTYYYLETTSQDWNSSISKVVDLCSQ